MKLIDLEGPGWHEIYTKSKNRFYGRRTKTNQMVCGESCFFSKCTISCGREILWLIVILCLSRQSCLFKALLIRRSKYFVISLIQHCCIIFLDEIGLNAGQEIIWRMDWLGIKLGEWRKKKSFSLDVFFNVSFWTVITTIRES